MTGRPFSELKEFGTTGLDMYPWRYYDDKKLLVSSIVHFVESRSRVTSNGGHYW